MDSRLPPEEFLGLKIGDAEVIRNGGGRVTADVLRFSSPAAAFLLRCSTLSNITYFALLFFLRSVLIREACNDSRASGLPVRYTSSE